jgi:hypothetical protein
VLQLLFQTAGEIIVSADWGRQQWQGKPPSRSPQMAPIFNLVERFAHRSVTGQSKDESAVRHHLAGRRKKIRKQSGPPRKSVRHSRRLVFRILQSECPMSIPAKSVCNDPYPAQTGSLRMVGRPGACFRGAHEWDIVDTCRDYRVSAATKDFGCTATGCCSR